MLRMGLRQIIWGAAATLLAGCGSPSAPDPPVADPVAPQADQVVTVAASELEIGEYLPPLDDGRIELTEPKGWKRFPRSKDYVVRFYEQQPTGLPRIIVTVDPSPDEGIREATAENLPKLRELVAAELADNESLLEPPLAMIIGDRPCIRYVLSASFRQEGAERQVLITVVAGRKYTIDLQIPKRTINTYKKAGYSVAGSLRRLAGADPPASDPPATIPPAIP